MDWTKIPVASYVFFGLFIATSIVHLVFCFFEMELPRKITKGFTTAFLGIAATIAIPTEPLVYIGCFLGMVGDVALLKKHKIMPFVIGMVSFLAGHILYILTYIKLCAPMHWGFYVFTGVYCVLFPVLFYNVCHKIVHQRGIAFGGTAYFGYLFLNFIWAIIACAYGHTNYCLLCVFGAFCFIVSDIFLSYTMFKRNVRRRDFYIMITYLFAQGLIVAGFVMTLIQ